MTTKNQFLDAAAAYAEKLHWRVFPVKSKAKEPLTEHGCLDASADLAQIRTWWQKWPRANIGIATGYSFFVLDVDPRNGGAETLEALVTKHGRLPDTLQQMSGGSGRHYLFNVPAGLTVKNGDLGPGLDLKGYHGYILGAPSIHPSGRAYVWDGAASILKQPILNAPPWLIAEIRNAQNGHGEPVRAPEHIAKGKQHTTLFRLGASMRAKGFEEPEIFAALWEANKKRCEQPGPEENIRKLAASICVQYEAGTQQAHLNGAAPSRAPQRDRIESEDAVVIYNSNYPDPTPLVDPILYPGLTILGGRPKAGKSWLALDLALAFVSGQKFAGYLDVAKPGRCLYVSLEERPRQTRHRLHRLTNMNDFLADLHFVFDLPPFMTGGAALLDRELTEHPAELLVIDSLLAATKQAQRKNADVMQSDYNIVATFRQLAEKHKSALVLVAHTRKAPGEFLDSIQGTSGTTAAADAVWVLGKGPEGESILNVTGREVRTTVFGLKRHSDDNPAWVITGEGDEVTQSEERREIIELLREQGPMKPLAIARAVRKNVGAIQRLVSKLYALNLITKTKYGTYQVLPSRPE